ncbi:hypothetical protein [Cellvibrio sp. PSBB006]|nr:hypothetical protein [Cellvibrio sp. PSBB006]
MPSVSNSGFCCYELINTTPKEFLYAAGVNKTIALTPVVFIIAANKTDNY